MSHRRKAALSAREFAKAVYGTDAEGTLRQIRMGEIIERAGGIEKVEPKLQREFIRQRKRFSTPSERKK